MRLVSQKTPKRNNSNGVGSVSAQQNGDGLVLKSNANSSPDSNKNNMNNKREACSDDSPRNMYNRLTVRRRSYDQNLQNLSRVKQSGYFKKRGSASKGSPTLVKQINHGDATSKSAQGCSLSNIKIRSIRLGDVVAVQKEERKHK
jgi:hypothetical protein